IVADSRNGPLRLVLKTLSYNASETWSTLGYSGDMPALLTRMSTVPNSSYAASVSASHWSQSPTLAATGNARRPNRSLTSPASFSQLSSLRLAMITSAPCSANASTISRPSPRLPPVTSATLPDRSTSATSESSLDEKHCVVEQSDRDGVQQVACRLGCLAGVCARIRAFQHDRELERR